MKEMLNTLYVTLPESYLSLDGGNVAVIVNHKSIGKVPLLNLEGIVTFGRSGASPALMQDCMARGIHLSFLTPNGKFMGRVEGAVTGNVLLRKKQYKVSEEDYGSCIIARNFIIGKLYNSRWQFERSTRDHAMIIDVQKFKEISGKMKQAISSVRTVSNLETLRGIEGNMAAEYFSIFDQMILQQKDVFKFSGRNRRPPRDRVNALLSFTYTLLSHDVTSALETVGLDPYVGFMHDGLHCR
ncbi:CRISPR-associated protein Cas1 [Paucilactobacillus suebicus DSM 5007 = KCTC 3549]|uniref:CRISPR-associated protein Cas1 n=1 Tax=Paucilactobacillus suebicus DSM 5007 = KCTC 3549 TaxID=1423807 RepID=A0A0R1W4B9_9LACO|nr:CRISPR-associated protein Cas1 [Paucilactobacillus suebicus DSM 5007 = KCTC 3549]